MDELSKEEANAIELAWPFKRNLLRKFSDVNTFAQIFWVAFDWFFIFSSIGMSLFFPNFLVYCFSVIVIASRQHALLVIAHDCAHFRLSINRTLNDFIGNYFCSYPCLIGVDAYRVHHWNHHHHLNSSKDPDWARKSQLIEWQFPMQSKQLILILGQQFLRGGFEWISLAYKINAKNGEKKNFFENENLGVFLLFSIVGSVCLAQGLLIELVLYWFVPLLFVMPLLQRFRSISEHFSLPRKNQFNSSRITKADFLSEFLISPHSVNYHLVHHLFPFVPHYNIKKVFKILMNDADFAKNAYVNEAFFIGKKSTWNDLVRTSDSLTEKFISAA